MTRFVFVAGGVISGVGKGVTTASVGRIFKEYGFSTTIIKIDPYINFDAGTLRPTEHGEVWVTHDGGEIDQDLGTYERFLDQDIPKKNNITTGQVYKAVIDRERRGEYLGQTVQFIPHIIDEVKQRILEASAGYEIVIIELGGTVGDYENVPYLFAIKALEREFGSDMVAHVLVTYLPVPAHIHEMKTKPTQQAIRMLAQEGICPDFIICRSNEPIDQVRKKKIEVFANIPSNAIISAPDLESIYEMPLNLEREQFGQKLLDHFKLKKHKPADLNVWQLLVNRIKNPKRTIAIAIVGKYLEIGDYSLIDSYVSIYQSIIHAGAQHDVKIVLTWLNAVDFEKNPSSIESLGKYDGIIVPGGFGNSGVEGKIMTIEYARKKNIPLLGLCYGMQLAVVEFARNVCLMSGAHTTEVDAYTKYPVVTLLPEQMQHMASGNIGATMRLGGYKASVLPESRVFQLYKAADRISLSADGSLPTVVERHRHRYEVNPDHVSRIESCGALFSGFTTRADGKRLMEFFELPWHRFFVTTQAHPEFMSRLGNPSPLFYGFIAAASQFAQEKSVGVAEGVMHTQPVHTQKML